MKAFVLAAGLGTRLSPLTNHTPKPLIPVLNISALLYTFSLLKRAGIREIICNLHHHCNAVRGFIESSNISGLTITFSEEPEILGTGGGLKKCEKLLGDEDFILVNSDIITDIDLSALIQHHQETGLPGTLTLFETPDAAAIGYVGVENGQVKDFRNQRYTGLVSSLIYTGVAILSPEVFRFLRAEFSGIVDTGFSGLIDNGGLSFYRHNGLWMDIGTMKNYWLANINSPFIINNMAVPMKLAIGISPHVISPDTIISSDAMLYNSVVGKECIIGADCTIRNSVLLPGVNIKSGSTIVNAIVDPHSITVMEDPNQNRKNRW
jgi:mannose-1-phosphate guanylyltransferase